MNNEKLIYVGDFEIKENEDLLIRVLSCVKNGLFIGFKIIFVEE